jgi:hypothetical protein
MLCAWLLYSGSYCYNAGVVFELHVCSSIAYNLAQKRQWTYIEAQFPERSRYRSTHLNGNGLKYSNDGGWAKQFEQKERERAFWNLEYLFLKHSGASMQFVALKQMYQDAVLKMSDISHVNLHYLRIKYKIPYNHLHSWILLILNLSPRVFPTIDSSTVPIEVIFLPFSHRLNAAVYSPTSQVGAGSPPKKKIMPHSKVIWLLLSTKISIRT